MKTILIIPIIGIVLISAYFGITYTHDYIFYILNLEKLEFEETYDNCYEEQCRQELETKGFVCNFQNQFGYVCIPPVDQDQINQRLDYWDQLFPPSYAYMDLIYDDKDFAIGLLKEIEFIDENQIKAIFCP